MKFLSRYKLLVYSLLAIFICSGLATILVYTFIKGNLYKTEINSYKDAVFVKSEEIRVTLNSANYVVESLSEDLFLKNYLLNSEKDLQNTGILKNLSLHNIAGVFSAIYLMDIEGNTLVSTDASFVGKNYAFRDYFVDAKEKGRGFDVVVGVTSQELGYYFASRIDDSEGKPLGVVVTKLKPEIIGDKMDFLKKDQNTVVMLADRYSVIVYSNKLEKLYNSFFVLNDTQKDNIVDSKRFLDKNILGMTSFLFSDFVKSNSADVNLLSQHGSNFYYKKIGDYNLFLFIEESIENQLATVLNISYKSVLIISFFALLANNKTPSGSVITI